jgi:hypothetical protein
MIKSIKEIMIGVIIGIPLLCVIWFWPSPATQADLDLYMKSEQAIIDKYCAPEQQIMPIMFNAYLQGEDPSELKKMFPDKDNEKDDFSYTIAETRMYGIPPSLVGRIDIVFGKWYWQYFSKKTKRMVVAHELVHARFYQEHLEDPNHFMYPTAPIISEEEFDQQFVNYLVQKCKK